MLVATKVRMSGSEKKANSKSNDISCIGSFTLQSCKTTAKKCTKKVCYTCKGFCFFGQLDLLIFCPSRCFRCLALHDFIFGLSRP